jgi:mevalonate pyrophosphate decarboxylase
MKEAYELHSICMSTQPMIIYFNDFSIKFIRFIENIREYLGQHSIGVTFDAGPHPVLFVHPKYKWVIKAIG